MAGRTWYYSRQVMVCNCAVLVNEGVVFLGGASDDGGWGGAGCLHVTSVVCLLKTRAGWGSIRR